MGRREGRERRVPGALGLGGPAAGRAGGEVRVADGEEGAEGPRGGELGFAGEPKVVEEVVVRAVVLLGAVPE